jgi:small subunit ribosomal protein S8
VLVPGSRMKEELCATLLREGFITGYKCESCDKRPVLRIGLKYLPDRTSVIRGLRRVSKPSLRIYRKRDELRPVRSGLGITVLSTSKGIMTGKQARAAQLGGEVLCEVW